MTSSLNRQHCVLFSLTLVLLLQELCQLELPLAVLVQTKMKFNFLHNFVKILAWIFAPQFINYLHIDGFFLCTINMDAGFSDSFFLLRPTHEMRNVNPSIRGPTNNTYNFFCGWYHGGSGNKLPHSSV